MHALRKRLVYGKLYIDVLSLVSLGVLVKWCIMCFLIHQVSAEVTVVGTLLSSVRLARTRWVQRELDPSRITLGIQHDVGIPSTHALPPCLPF